MEPLIRASPAVIVPVVLITEAPPIVEVPFINPVVRIALSKVLLYRVSDASRVTTVPEVGNAAVEATPVPPRVVGNTPEVAAREPMLRAPNCGTVPPSGIIRVWLERPAGVENRLPELLPRMTPLAVNVDAPVPPLSTFRMPVLICRVASSAGISAATRVVPLMARPFASTTYLA